jgi:hypothetical protein
VRKFCQQLRALLAEGRQETVGVSVRLGPAHDRINLINRGLSVRSQAGRVVVGEVALSRVQSLAELPEVEHIELRRLL